ncbi:hypothetical protein BJ508DRAFT_15999 [Ascobolus immersus RN42]|uniref:Uncharacterized protein n=1 Tax=Ascobolus immersus RN42 TaxID=1160509 RepID=A0A3N4HRA2_ASCIM|nr:hypothetical protein BJ508DRAFT_15999 [Ascobolus immersus RN42]
MTVVRVLAVDRVDKVGLSSSPQPLLLWFASCAYNFVFTAGTALDPLLNLTMAGVIGISPRDIIDSLQIVIGLCKKISSTKTSANSTERYRDILHTYSRAIEHLDRNSSKVDHDLQDSFNRVRDVISKIATVIYKRSHLNWGSELVNEIRYEVLQRRDVELDDLFNQLAQQCFAMNMLFQSFSRAQLQRSETMAWERTEMIMDRLDELRQKEPNDPRNHTPSLELREQILQRIETLIKANTSKRRLKLYLEKPATVLVEEALAIQRKAKERRAAVIRSHTPDTQVEMDSGLESMLAPSFVHYSKAVLILRWVMESDPHSSSPGKENAMIVLKSISAGLFSTFDGRFPSIAQVDELLIRNREASQRLGYQQNSRVSLFDLFSEEEWCTEDCTEAPCTINQELNTRKVEVLAHLLLNDVDPSYSSYLTVSNPLDNQNTLLLCEAHYDKEETPLYGVNHMPKEKELSRDHACLCLDYLLNPKQQLSLYNPPNDKEQEHPLRYKFKNRRDVLAAVNAVCNIQTTFSYSLRRENTTHVSRSAPDSGISFAFIDTTRKAEYHSFSNFGIQTLDLHPADGIMDMDVLGDSFSSFSLDEVGTTTGSSIRSFSNPEAGPSVTQQGRRTSNGINGSRRSVSTWDSTLSTVSNYAVGLSHDGESLAYDVTLDQQHQLILYCCSNDSGKRRYAALVCDLSEIELDDRCKYCKEPHCCHVTIRGQKPSHTLMTTFASGKTSKSLRFKLDKLSPPEQSQQKRVKHIFMTLPSYEDKQHVHKYLIQQVGKALGTKHNEQRKASVAKETLKGSLKGGSFVDSDLKRELQAEAIAGSRRGSVFTLLRRNSTASSPSTSRSNSEDSLHGSFVRRSTTGFQTDDSRTALASDADSISSGLSRSSTKVHRHMPGSSRRLAPIRCS